MAEVSSLKVSIYAALAGNVLVAATKVAAAVWTGSSAMLSEAIHSLVDTVNEVLLLYGLRRAARPADAEHPFGHGRELSFWSFIVALLIFALAAAGTWASTSLGIQVADGAASLAIGGVLAATAMLLARESKSLLIGERAHHALSESVLRIAAAEPTVARANGVLTAQLAPDQILAALSLEFADDLTATDIERAVIDIEEKVRAAHPEVVSLFVKPQTARTFREHVKRDIADGSGVTPDQPRADAPAD